VIGFIELLHQTNMSSQQMEYLGLMQSSSLSLMSVVNDLLDYTKIQAGKLQLEYIPFDVRGVLNGCRQAIEPKTTEKGLTLQCKPVPVGLPAMLLGDPNRLRQILLNLVQNAVKFTKTGGITMSVTNVVQEQGGRRFRLRFEVEDSGIGISPEHREHIFRKYQQADASIARNYGGTGLGLAICKSLVEAMGGAIGLESEFGRGTKLFFEIPFGAPPTVAEPVQETQADAEDLPSLRILVVEDNKLNQKLMKAMLQRMGHTVHVSCNGAIGVEDAEKESFDAILMDVQMPVMDGIEATKLIRRNGNCESVLPIIGLTASYQPADWQFYRDCGMNDCIGKPARIQTVRRILDDVVALSKATGSCEVCGEVHSRDRTATKITG
jgi:CheY-like chemotaxis protein